MTKGLHSEYVIGIITIQAMSFPIQAVVAVSSK
jgi:hypothetical protein